MPLLVPVDEALAEERNELREQVSQLEDSLAEQSLGTSGDYEEAIVAGSSMVRIGETLLGPRL